MANFAKSMGSMKRSETDSLTVRGGEKVKKIDMAEELRAINAGRKGGYTPAQRDSVAKTFDRKAWMQTLDKTGYKLANKK